MVDRKGILSFLLVTFAVTYLIEGGLVLYGFRISRMPALYGQFIIAGVMWVPSLATVLTVKLITHEGFSRTGLRVGPLKPYLRTAGVIPVCFTVIYGLTWLTGIGTPDWKLSAFRSLISSSGADLSSMPAPEILLSVIFLVSLLVGPTINGIFGFGEEFGWRGYLLPKLMPLGKLKAYFLIGVIWGLWHAPLVLIGFNYPGYPVLGVLAMTGLTTTFGIYINELRLRHDSSLLSGWVHGAFNGQSYGIWRLLFPDVNPIIGGMTGLIAMIVWLGLGVWSVRRKNL